MSENKRTDWVTDAEGYGYRNKKTGEYRTSLPDHEWHSGPYGDYQERAWYYTNRNGEVIKAKSQLDAEFEGQDPWAHG